MTPAGTMVAAAESKSASLADLPDAVLCEQGLYGYRLALEIFDNEIFAVLSRWKQPADIRLDFRFTGAIPRLLDMAELVPGPQRDRIFTRFREMQGEALKELEKMPDAAEKRAQAKSASLADLPAPDAPDGQDLPDGPQADLRRREELLADLRALRADQFAALLGELLGTAGMEAADLRIYTTVLRERLSPDAPLTWQAVLGKTLLKKGPQK